MKRFLVVFRLILTSCLVVLVSSSSTWESSSKADSVHIYTRPYEFDYFGWTIDALWSKINAASIGPIHEMTYSQQRQVLRDYFQILADIDQLENSIQTLYADPLTKIKPGQATALEAELNEKKAAASRLGVLAEDVLQNQVSQALNDLGLTYINQPFPPVLFHVTDLPKDLIVSPRNVILQAESISLYSDISVNEQVEIESEVEENTDYSALVVPVGGVGTYPTMVIRTDNLASMLETVAHEWTHNYLTTRPLGLSYFASPALRTMNETTANIAGKEISQYVLKKFYWDLLHPQEEQPYQTFEVGFFFDQSPADEPFNFNKEMYLTRQHVDELLKDGKVDEAENYMDARRLVFWDHGYHIRKLNQAYFAFYGAYADQSYSAAGTDPVGDDVRLLRQHSTSLADFINTMSWLHSFQGLKNLLHSY